MVSLKAFLIVLALVVAFFGAGSGVEAGKSTQRGDELRYKVAITMAFFCGLVTVGVAYLAGAL